MANLTEMTVEQLRRAVEIKEQIESLQNELNNLLTGTVVRISRPRGRPPGKRGPGRPPSSGRRTMSTAARAAIAAAQKARWAKQKGEVPVGDKPAKRKRKMSAAGRAAISAAAKKRWAKAKAAGKNKL